MFTFLGSLSYLKNYGAPASIYTLLAVVATGVYKYWPAGINVKFMYGTTMVLGWVIFAWYCWKNKKYEESCLNTFDCWQPAQYIVEDLLSSTKYKTEQPTLGTGGEQVRIFYNLRALAHCINIHHVSTGTIREIAMDKDLPWEAWDGYGYRVAEILRDMGLSEHDVVCVTVSTSVVRKTQTGSTSFHIYQIEKIGSLDCRTCLHWKD